MPYAIAVVPTNTIVNRRIRENNDLEEDCDAEVGAVVPLSVAARKTLRFAPLALAMVPIVRFRVCNAAMYLILRVQCIWSRDSTCNVSVSSLSSGPTSNPDAPSTSSLNDAAFIGPNPCDSRVFDSGDQRLDACAAHPLGVSDLQAASASVFFWYTMLIEKWFLVVSMKFYVGGW